MKINKELRKQFDNQLKAFGKTKGFKSISGILWKVVDDNFTAILCSIIGTKVDFRVDVKKYNYDNIFWDIMNMSSNANARESLRANGAFTSPTIFIKEGQYELLESEVLDNFESLAERLIDEFDNEIHQFLANNDINEYVINANEPKYGLDVLKCLAYIDIKDYSKAMEIAKEKFEKNNSGGFINEDKTFFEWAILYLKDKL